MHPMNPEGVLLMRIIVYATVGALVGTAVGLWIRHRDREKYVPLIWNGETFTAAESFSAENAERPADLNAWWPNDGPRQ